jgi:hypothetical protein
MSDSAGIFWAVMLGAWAFSNSLPSTTATEYTEAKRCVVRITTDVSTDVKTGKPIKRDEDGKWQWYTPTPSDLICSQVNANRTNYRVYGEAGKVTAWVEEGQSKGTITEYRNCVIGDAKNWNCSSSFGTMTEGVFDKAHHISWWEWHLNWLLKPAVKNDGWYTQE